MGYFGYQIPNSMTVLIGAEKQEIINTLRYYRDDRGQRNFDIPREQDLLELGDVHVTCGLAILHKDHFIDAEVEDNVYFHVNANAFEYVQSQVRDYEGLRRGDLYKFIPGVDIFGLFFLPESIMKSLKEHDWEQYREQIDSWTRVREDALDGLERDGHLIRAESVIEEDGVIKIRRRVTEAGLEAMPASKTKY